MARITLSALGILILILALQSERRKASDPRVPQDIAAVERLLPPGQRAIPKAELPLEVKVDPECEEEWSSLAALSRIDVESLTKSAVGFCRYLPEDHPLLCAQREFAEACQGLIGVEDVPISKIYRVRAAAKCLPSEVVLEGKPAEEGFDPRAETCRAKAVYYRMSILSQSIVGKSLVDITDSERLFAAYVVAKDPAKRTAFARRLVEVSPKDKRAARLWLFADEDPAAERHLEAIDPADEFLVERKLARAQASGDPAALRKAAHDVSSKASRSLVIYYLAWAAYQEKNPAEALELLAEAIALDPQDLRAKTTRDLITIGAETSGAPVFLRREDAHRRALALQN